MTSRSQRMKRAASADRLYSERCRSDFDLASSSSTSAKCSLVGFPYCCTKHYGEYRGWPYYLDPPLGYPAYYRRYRYWPLYPYYPYSDYYYYYRRRPWLYGYARDDDYYGDYLRGYAEGMRKFDAEQQQRRLRTASGGDGGGGGGGDLLDGSGSGSNGKPYYWWRYRPSPSYYYSRYLY